MKSKKISKMLNFRPVYPGTSQTPVVFKGDVIPKEFDIYYKAEKEFLPDGENFADLSHQQKKNVQNAYRFSPLRPGIYQGLTGFAQAVQ